MFSYVGSRTTRERKARGPGLSVYDFDLATGAWTLEQVVGDLVNPSFLVVRDDRVYAVHGDGSEVSAFRIDPPTGRLSGINRVSTGGRNPVHLAIDASGQFLVVANYATGTLALIDLASDGSLGALRDLASLPGLPGPHPVEQQGSHPHHVVLAPDRRTFVTPDKGVDRIFFHEIDAGNGKLLARDLPWVAARPGAAPRHVTFSPKGPNAFVINELDSTITVYRIEESNFVLVQRISTVPESFSGPNTGAEIAVTPCGRFVFASNRGHDSIVRFDIDGETGELGSPGWTPCGGAGPRYFGIDPSGSYVVVANELTDSIVTFAIDPSTGSLAHSGPVVSTGSPTCIAWLAPTS